MKALEKANGNLQDGSLFMHAKAKGMNEDKRSVPFINWFKYLPEVGEDTNVDVIKEPVPEDDRLQRYKGIHNNLK